MPLRRRSLHRGWAFRQSGKWHCRRALPESAQRYRASGPAADRSPRRERLQKVRVISAVDGICSICWGRIVAPEDEVILSSREGDTRDCHRFRLSTELESEIQCDRLVYGYLQVPYGRRYKTQLGDRERIRPCGQSQDFVCSVALFGARSIPMPLFTTRISAPATGNRCWSATVPSMVVSRA